MNMEDKPNGDEEADSDLIQGKKRRSLGRIVHEDAPIFRSARTRSKPRPASRQLSLEDERFAR